VFSGKARDPNDDDVCVVETMLDINSGDLRRTRLVSDGVPQYEIYESELSKEVRRLDIPIPEERQWKTIAVPPLPLEECASNMSI